jgi:hypothetical protein
MHAQWISTGLTPTATATACLGLLRLSQRERERERDEIQTRQTLSCIIPVIPHFKVQWELPYVESHVVIDGCHLTILICC